MTKIKCIALERSDLINLAKAIEDFQNSHNLVSKGSIPFSNLKDGNVGVIMFFPQPLEEILPKKQVEESPRSSNAFNLPEKWKLEEPTLKQRNALKKMGLSWEEINALSKYDASKRIGGNK